MRRVNRSTLWTVALLAGAGWTIGLAAGAGADLRVIHAVQARDLDAARRGLDAGADANQAETDGTTALHWAARYGDLDAASLLVRAGASVTAANRYGVQPIALASVNGDAKMLELLLRAGADPRTVMSKGETVLMTASRTGNADAVRVLLDYGAEASAKETWRGQTALMWAAGEGHRAVVRLLLARGADPAARSPGGFTALLFAIREGHLETAVSLLDAGADVHDAIRPDKGRQPGAVSDSGLKPGDGGLTAFLLAAANAHYALAALLLERGADPNAAPRGWTALHQMSWVRKAGIAGSNNPAPEGSGAMDSLAFVRILARHGANLDARVARRPPAGITRLNMIGGTPFLLAARTADAPLMQLLAELGADPRLANEDNTTPLMVAAGIGTAAPGEDPGTEPEVLEAVQLALTLKNDIDAVDNNGETAMHGAATKHAPSVVRFLVDAGANPDVWNRPNKEGFTPLKIAQGVQRGMNILSSRPTEEAVRDVLTRTKAQPATASR